MENYLPNPPWEGWQTIREIGSGSYGTVYEISRTLLNGKTESAAMKMMSLPTKKTEIDRLYRSGYTKERIASNYRAACENIMEEYSLMRKLDGCENIVSCTDIHYEPHTDDIGWDIYIRMELLTPLEDVLSDIVPEAVVRRVACDLCKALEECRKHNIVHRDIKPQNLFVSADSKYKLGDFGIAREMEATQQGTQIGTVNYIAPEIYTGKTYGSRSDIYSLGLVLYWMLNERVLPFAQKSVDGDGMCGMEEARVKRISGEALPPPAHGSADLQRIVLKACAYNPEDRYASASEMLTDLRGDPSGFPFPQAQTTAKPKKSGKPSLKIIIPLVAVLALVVGGILCGVLFSRNNDEPQKTIADDIVDEIPTGSELVLPEPPTEAPQITTEAPTEPPVVVTEAPTEAEPVYTQPPTEAELTNPPVARILSAYTTAGTELGSSNVSSTRTFVAGNVLDRDIDTCWCASTAYTGGAGAELYFQLQSGIVNGFMLVNGNLYWPSEGLYKSNGQVKSFTLTFSDGSQYSFTAPYNDTASTQYHYFSLPNPVRTDYIILTVDSGYAGVKYTENVCITEFDIY